MKALKYNQHVYELMNGDYADPPALVEEKEAINLDISHIIRTLVDLRDGMEARGYNLSGQLNIDGKLKVTITL